MIDMELVKDLIHKHGVRFRKNGIGQIHVIDLNEEFILDLIDSRIEFEYQTPHFVIFVGRIGCKVSQNEGGLVLNFPTGSITIPKGFPDGKVIIAPF